jgi:XTP/dITP diphosphohydrolase
VQRVLLATNNPGKAREFRRMLASLPVEVMTPSEVGIHLDVEEAGDSYEANAVLKAEAFAAAGNCVALADDSGIEVDALDGRPGYLSARYGGPGLDDRGRVELLLSDLRDVPDGERGARFRAVVAIAAPGRATRTFEGVAEGAITREVRGNGGFGYDPIFVRADGQTTAELSDEEKDAISHRGQAVRAALEYVRELTGC